MRLGDLLRALDGETTLPESQDREVLDIAHDSRKVKPGTLFVAVRGFHSDGHQFIPQALQQGAVAVISEEKNANTGACAAPVICVPDSRVALARIAGIFYGHPSKRLKVIGITGTKGKTTTSYLVKSMIEAAGHQAGLIGTIDYRVKEKVYPAPNTTPESLELQKLLSEMVDARAGYCVMEVSSHALALGRIDGCAFETAVFTNLAQDHLDFHKDMESYAQAKLLLFKILANDKTAVINADDAQAPDFIRGTKAVVYTFGMSEKADIHPTQAVNRGINGLSFTARTPNGGVAVESLLVGSHNVYNILCAIGVGVALGFGTDAIARGIAAMQAVPGRMEKVEEGQAFSVFVDYAHTEDSLESLLNAVREAAQGNVITLFGCGGERDRTKRPKMGAAAVKGSDIVILTTDNPRTEDPLVIIAEIEEGMRSAGARVSSLAEAHHGVPGKTPYLIIPDRADAIKSAIALARPGDAVVLAGKGHETYQIAGEHKIHFDDREIAREALKKMHDTS